MNDEPDDKPIGVQQDSVDPRREAPPDTAETRHTLVDLARRFEIFTPALLVTHGGFDRDPVREYAAVHPAPSNDQRPMAYDSPCPLFAGLGRSVLDGVEIDWDRRVYLIEKSRWEACGGFIAAIAMVDRSRRYYARVKPYTMLLVDTHALSRSPTMTTFPTVQLNVFGLSSNEGVVYLQPALATVGVLPYPRQSPAQEQIIAEAAAVLDPVGDEATLSATIGKRIV